MKLLKLALGHGQRSKLKGGSRTQLGERAHLALQHRGTFVRNLRRVLNSCLLIQTLIFARDNYAEVPQESTALVDLVSLLPSGIKSIVFDNVLDVKSFQQIFDNHDLRLEGIAVKNSPHLRKLKPNLFSMWTQNFGQLGNDLRCSLTWFDLSGNDLGDDICAKIMKAVCIDGAFPVLEQLSLSGNEIREGTQMIKVFQTLQNVGLCKNKLKQLDLSCNELGWWDEARAERKGGDVAVEIMSLLANCTFPLRSLDLSENNLGNRNFVHACSASIRSNRTLMELNLNQNSISGPSAKILIESMNKMKTLCYLRLEGNKLPISADLKSQLQLVQLKSRSKKVQEFSQKPLSTNMNGNHPSVGDQTVGYSQICVLQAAPLVFISLRGTVTPAPPPLNFSKEKEVFKECFKKSALKMDIATTARLQECLNTKARVLHYSGHGSPHHLYFENGAGVGQQLGHQQLKKIAVMAGVGQDSSDGIQLVFVSACHSYQSGKAFVDAGVKHVICCKYEATVLDEAAIRFTKQLYTALISGCTVQNSFNQALLAIEIAPKIGAQDRDLEMEKYLLLPQEGDHDVNIFDDSDGVGRNDDDHIIDDDITFSRLPVPCKGFLGREVDLMNIIDAILDEHRFINVIGASGIGKSSIMAAACQYIYERKSDMKKSSIIYLQNDVLSCEKTFSKSNPILSSLHQEMVNHELIDARTLPFDETMEDILEDRMFSILNKRKSLLVLDLGPALEKEEDGRLSTFCERILSKGINVLVLVVTVKPLEMNVNRVLKKEIVLGGFSLEASSKLLTDNCTFQQVKDTMQKNRLRDFICLKKISKSRKKAILQFLGKGLPVKIIKLASEMNKFKLRKLIYNCIIPRGEWIEEDCMILLSSLIDAIIKWIQNGDTLNFMNSITMYGLFCKLFHDKEGIERLIQFFSLTESNATCSKSKEILNEIMSTLRGGNPIIICNLAFAKEKGDIFHTFVAAGLHILVQKGLRKNHDVNGEKDWIVEGSIPTNEGDLNGVGV